MTTKEKFAFGEGTIASTRGAHELPGTYEHSFLSFTFTGAKIALQS